MRFATFKQEPVMTNVSTYFHRASHILTVLLVTVSVLLFTGRATAQEHGTPMALPGAATSMSTVQTPAAKGFEPVADPVRQLSHAGGPQEGIKVHGHWIIDVKNPDGTLVKHNTFENSLVYDGTQYLTALLSGYGVGGDYAIYFTNATATPTASPTTNVVCPAPASTTTNTFPYCSIVQNVNSQPGLFHCLHYVCVSGLTVTPTFGSGAGVTLVGAITAPQAGAVVNVYVGFAGCNIAATTTPPQPTGPATITPTACETSTTNSYGGTMSSTLITPITVVAGQIIQITVTYTFS
jgi:hypothetical protein